MVQNLIIHRVVLQKSQTVAALQKSQNQSQTSQKTSQISQQRSQKSQAMAVRRQMKVEVVGKLEVEEAQNLIMEAQVQVVNLKKRKHA